MLKNLFVICASKSGLNGRSQLPDLLQILPQAPLIIFKILSRKTEPQLFASVNNYKNRMMDFFTCLFNNLRNRTSWVMLVIAVSLISCSKGDGDIVIPAIPTPAPGNNSPTGDIQLFTITDTMVAFNYGSTIKWLINGTNNNTVVSINGVKVGIYGVLDTGPLKQNTKFTLSVNSGKEASITVKVFDSLSTALWNEGKRLKQTRAQMFLVPAGRTDAVWVDTAINAEKAIRRIYFNFNGTTTLLRISSSGTMVIDGGNFTTNIPASRFTWGGVSYTIESLTNLELIVRYVELQPNGTMITRRDYYAYE